MGVLDSMPPRASPGLAAEIDRIAAVAADLNRRISLGGIGGDLAGAAGTNADGDTQKALDVIADEAYLAAMRGGNIRHYASEEQDGVVEMEAGGEFALAIDPLDGSSNIDTNVSIGTIFGIYPAAGGAEASFLRPGRDLLAAGYVIFGPQCGLVATLGHGIVSYVLDPASGRFRRLDAPVAIPPETGEYAINASNRRHWDGPVRSYVDDLMAGPAGPLGRDYNMRWVGSLVADTNRILTRGGVFLYPSDAREGYAEGRLRYVYECAPIALLVEQAGGRATDGRQAILDRRPDSLHARAPFVFGSAAEVDRVAAYHAADGGGAAAASGGRP